MSSYGQKPPLDSFHCKLDHYQLFSLYPRVRNVYKLIHILLILFICVTGTNRSAIAVVRISGPKSRTIIQSLTKLKSTALDPRKCIYRKIFDPVNGELLDNGIVVWFPGPRSYTGEDSAELHVHGGPAVVSSVIRALHKFPDCRMAEPGKCVGGGFECFRFHACVTTDSFSNGQANLPKDLSWPVKLTRLKSKAWPSC